MNKLNNVDKVYHELIEDILLNGIEKSDRTGTGTYSVFGKMVKFDMRDGNFPLLTTKKMYYNGIMTELLWFLRGDTNIQWLVNNNCNIWNGDAYKHYITSQLKSFPAETDSNLNKDEFIEKIKIDYDFAEKWGNLGPIYGKQWVNWEPPAWNIENGVINQVQTVIDTLRTNPDSRRIIINAWNPGELSDMVLPPCHLLSQFWTRELTDNERAELMDKKRGYDKDNPRFLPYLTSDLDDIPTRGLSLEWYQRSCDVPLGIPFNIASYGLLLNIIAKMVNMVPLELTGMLGDCHIYTNQIDGVNKQLKLKSYEQPTLELNDNLKFDGTIEEFLNSCSIEDFKIIDYISHPTIKFPLSN